jgi:NADPH:quinone reductase-like Zn-dependent oxidoreductase
VKVLAAPINPSDLHFMKGYYHNMNLFDIPCPNVPGWEGAGEVVKSGGGMSTWGWIGKRVSFVRKTEGNRKLLGGAY